MSIYFQKYLLLLGFVFSLMQLSQANEFKAKYPFLFQFNANNSLPTNIVYKIHQDQDGFIWMGCFSGLVRYDGKNFDQINFNGEPFKSTVWGVAEHPDGRIFLMNDHDSILYYQDGQIHTLDIDIPKFYSSQKPTLDIDDDGRIWINVANEHLVCYDQGKTYWLDETILFQEVLHLNGMSIKDSHLFVKTKLQIPIDSTILLCDTLGMKVIAIHNDLKRIPIGEDLYWSDNYRIYEFHNGKLRLFKEIAGIDEIPKLIIRDLIPFKDKIIALSSHGLFILDHEFNLLYRNPVLQDISVGGSVVDMDGNLWISTLDKGVFLIKYPFLDRIVENRIPLPGHHVGNIASNGINTVVWADFNGPIYFLREGQLDSIPFNKRRADGDFFGSVQWLDPEQFLFGQDDGLWICNLKDKSISSVLVEQGIPFKLQGSSIHSVNKSYYYQNPRLYIGKVSSLRTYTIVDQEIIEQRFLPDIRVYEIKKYIQDTILIFTDQGCFFSLGNQVYSHPILTDKSPVGVVASCMVGDSLLISTRDIGTFLYSNGRFEKVFQDSNRICRDLLCDEPYAYISTNIGVNRFKIQEPGSFTNINYTNGLKSNEINAICKLNEQLFVASANGVDVINDAYFEFQDSIYDIYLRNSFELVRDEKNRIEIQPNENLHLQLQSIYFGDTKNIQYRYQLREKGDTSAWQISKSGELNLVKPPPGTYELVIQAGTDDYGWKRAELTMPIHALPAFYQTSWFILLIGFLILCLFVAIVIWTNYRTRKKEQIRASYARRMSEFELKALQAQMNPHFISNAMSAINNYILKNDRETASRYLTRFSKLSRMVFESSARDMVSLENEIDMIKAYLDLEILRYNGGISYEIKVPEELDTEEISIPSMILQPLVENIFKHAFKSDVTDGKILIDFLEVNEDILIIGVEDNGSGFSRADHLREQRLKSSDIIEDKLEILKDLSKMEVTIKEGMERKISGNENGLRIEVEVSLA